MRILLIVFLLLTGCSTESDWDMVSHHDFPSPDGQHIATVFEMCCYCTTGYFPQLSVRLPGEKLGKSGNVFQGGPGDSITVRWTSQTNLVVEHHTGGKMTSHSPDFTNITGVAVNFGRP